MGKWIKTIVAEYKESHGESCAHGISPQEMAAFIDGRLDQAQRQKVIHHLNRCQKCSDILDMALMGQAENSQRDREDIHGEQPALGGKFKPLYSLAASILLMVMIGSGLYHYGPWNGTSPGEMSVTLFMDGRVKELLMENNNTRWESQARIKGLATLLSEHGIKAGTLKGVVMDTPYVAQKSFFAEDEEVVITIKDGIAYLEVKKMSPQ
ncbi:zf-HC2 domain-containing protein [uncultured Desulfobacter sp.]|uniref:zf-HC2 domain-containing protein n=1 Tax=uncultured Desulfobacter sp. TaxID=240139 RepID=UPI002AA6AEEB|nr:zf-HC2 domain-containing protein [uncultured Desulfobacter sp.]